MNNETNDLEQQNKKERDQLLHSIFTRQAKAIDDLLRTTPVEKLKASMIQSITQFLRLSDVSAETIEDEDEDTRAGRELAAQIKAMHDNMSPDERREWDAVEAGRAALVEKFGNEDDDD